MTKVDLGDCLTDSKGFLTIFPIYDIITYMFDQKLRCLAHIFAHVTDAVMRNRFRASNPVLQDDVLKSLSQEGNTFHHDAIVAMIIV